MQAVLGSTEIEIPEGTEGIVVFAPQNAAFGRVGKTLNKCSFKNTEAFIQNANPKQHAR